MGMIAIQALVSRLQVYILGWVAHHQSLLCAGRNIQKCLFEKAQTVRPHEDTGEVPSSAVERQAWACPEAQGRKSDTETAGPCPAIMNFWTCPLTCDTHGPSQSSVHCLSLTMGSLPYVGAPSSRSIVCGQSRLPTPCARAFDNLVRAPMAEKRWGDTGIGELLKVLCGQKSCHSSSSCDVPCSQPSWPHFFLTTHLSYYFSLRIFFLVRNWGPTRLNKLSEITKLLWNSTRFERRSASRFYILSILLLPALVGARMLGDEMITCRGPWMPNWRHATLFPCIRECRKFSWKI